jgi:capsular polysaccharide biosynthesis protein
MTDNPTRFRRQPVQPGRTGLLRPWLLLATGMLVGGLAGGAYGTLKTPTYTATSYVVAVPTENSDPGSALGFAQAYGRTATQLAVLDDAQSSAGVPARTLRRNVRTATSPDAPMIAVSATSPRPGLASGMANAVTRALTRHANKTKGSTHVELVQFSEAVRPAEPTSASPMVTGLVGTSAGGLLGGLALLVRPKRTESDSTALPAAVPAPAAAADVRGQL